MLCDSLAFHVTILVCLFIVRDSTVQIIQVELFSFGSPSVTLVLFTVQFDIGRHSGCM